MKLHTIFLTSVALLKNIKMTGALQSRIQMTSTDSLYLYIVLFPFPLFETEIQAVSKHREAILLITTGTELKGYRIYSSIG